MEVPDDEVADVSLTAQINGKFWIAIVGTSKEWQFAPSVIEDIGSLKQ